MGFSKLHTKEVLRTNLCDSKDAFILVRGKITIIGHNLTQVAFKYCAPFIQCITKIDETTINDAEDLCLVMLVYNLLEYSSNYFDRAGSLYSLIKKMKQIILMLILWTVMLLNFSSTRLNY